MTFEEVRKKHPEFIYNGFKISHEGKNLKVIFDFEILPDIKFRPEITFPNIFPHGEWEASLDNLVFNLGMVEMLSYWKATCSPKITIKAGYLDEEQIKFWKKLLIKGLGEFFYTNQIDFTQDNLVEFNILGKSDSSGPEALTRPLSEGQNDKLSDQDLILVGGGKDSAVTLDTIAKSGKEFNCLLLNPTDAAIKIARAAGCEGPIIIKRIIDPKLLELNEQSSSSNKMDYLNGHTPFSAYLAFLGTLAGVLYDYKNIVVSNESSSNEANVTWKGEEINHQYSKSLEFEKDFRQYSQKYLAPVNYYSFLRDLNELQISEKFSKMERYHKLFISCNKGAKQGVWCGKCSKCVSTYLTLYPYLGEKTKEIFGKDLLEDASLIPIVKGLLRENDVVKPFECVATIEEIKKSILIGRERAKKDRQEIPKILQINL